MLDSSAGLFGKAAFLVKKEKGGNTIKFPMHSSKNDVDALGKSFCPWD
jgi:hypothetical protein